MKTTFLWFCRIVDFGGVVWDSVFQNSFAFPKKILKFRLSRFSRFATKFCYCVFFIGEFGQSRISELLHGCATFVDLVDFRVSDHPDLVWYGFWCFWLFSPVSEIFFLFRIFFVSQPPKTGFSAITFFSSDEIFFSFQIVSRFDLLFRLVEKNLVTFFTYVNLPKVAFWSYYMEWPFFGLSRFSAFPTCLDLSHRVFDVFVCFDVFDPFWPVSQLFFSVLTFFFLGSLFSVFWP